MRSDRDKRSDTEREIDDFLSRFEDPADGLSSELSSYLNEKNTTKMTAAQTFYWKDGDSPDFTKSKSEDKSSDKAKVKAEDKAVSKPVEKPVSSDAKKAEAPAVSSGETPSDAPAADSSKTAVK